MKLFLIFFFGFLECILAGWIGSKYKNEVIGFIAAAFLALILELMTVTLILSF